MTTERIEISRSFSGKWFNDETITHVCFAFENTIPIKDNSVNVKILIDGINKNDPGSFYNTRMISIIKTHYNVCKHLNRFISKKIPKYVTLETAKQIFDKMINVVIQLDSNACIIYKNIIPSY